MVGWVDTSWREVVGNVHDRISTIEKNCFTVLLNVCLLAVFDDTPRGEYDRLSRLSAD